jgi:Txe/YoeB family toxin of toxin-antitoxin system
MPIHFGHAAQKIEKYEINKLLADALRNPFEGLGKPESLKENFTGLWSRRIDEKK